MVQKKVNFYKKLLFFVNIPLVIGIPIICELGFLDHKPNVKTIYAFLHLTDFFLCFNSVIIYSTVQKLVTAISYLPESHKIEMKQMCGRFLSEKIELFDPKELMKSRR